jgi:hypothetical protein
MRLVHLIAPPGKARNKLDRSTAANKVIATLFQPENLTPTQKISLWRDIPLAAIGGDKPERASEIFTQNAASDVRGTRLASIGHRCLPRCRTQSSRI